MLWIAKILKSLKQLDNAKKIFERSLFEIHAFVATNEIGLSVILSGYNIHAGQNCSQFFMRIQNYMIFFLQANLFENFNILEQNSKRAHDFMSKMLNICEK